MSLTKTTKWERVFAPADGLVSFPDAELRGYSEMIRDTSGAAWVRLKVSSSRSERLRALVLRLECLYRALRRSDPESELSLNLVFGDEDVARGWMKLAMIQDEMKVACRTIGQWVRLERIIEELDPLNDPLSDLGAGVTPSPALSQAG